MPALKYWDPSTSSWKTLTTTAPAPHWAQVIGDGASTSFTLNHNLGTRHVIVSVYQNSPPYSEIEVDVERTSASTVTIRTAPTVPGISEYVAVVSSGAQGVGQGTMDTWHVVGTAGEPAFQNGWTNDVNPPPCGFRKYPDGTVRLRGTVKGGTMGWATPIFTLPEGYRPAGFAARFEVVANDLRSAVVVSYNGVVGVAAGNNVWVDLSPVEFDTETVSTYLTGPQGPPGPTGAPTVTTLTPGQQGIPNPVPDGFEVRYLADATNGVVWNLRYRAGSASPYKWEFVGGPEMRSNITSGALVSTANIDAITRWDAGPNLTVPLSGDYDLRAMPLSCQTHSTGNSELRLRFHSNNVSLATFAGYMVGDAQWEAGNCIPETRATLAKDDVLRLSYATNGTNIYIGVFVGVAFMIRPIRVSA